MMSSICHVRRLCACQAENRYFLKYRRELQSKCLLATGLNPISNSSSTQKRASRSLNGVVPQKTKQNRFRAMPRYGIQLTSPNYCELAGGGEIVLTGLSGCAGTVGGAGGGDAVGTGITVFCPVADIGSGNPCG
jgi:hypothetical protein